MLVTGLMKAATFEKDAVTNLALSDGELEQVRSDREGFERRP
jgi:hypothetical protein